VRHGVDCRRVPEQAACACEPVVALFRVASALLGLWATVDCVLFQVTSSFSSCVGLVGSDADDFAPVATWKA
jgi:hypothetical protein